MKWSIVTDSSCDLLPKTCRNEQVQIISVPFVIRIGEQDYIDDEELNTLDMIHAMEQESSASYTSCPSPQEWLTQFEKADYIIAITISSQLSGSMNSAVAAKEMALDRFPEKKIAILDSRSTGPELVLAVEEIEKQIESGMDFDSVVSFAEDFFLEKKTIFALNSFDNLVKNGRMSKLSGFIARKLKMWGIGAASDEGKIVIKGKAKGAAKAIEFMLNSIRKDEFQGGKIAISHCHNLGFAEKLKERILETWKNTEVKILPTRGLCSYYAERGGIIVSY